MREWIAGGFSALVEEFGDSLAAAQQGFEETIQLVPVIFQPLRRNPAQHLVEDFRGEIQDAIDPWLEVHKRVY